LDFLDFVTFAAILSASNGALNLEIKYGRNFVEKNVRRMVRFYEEFSDFNILPPMAAKLSWSHFIELFPLKSMESKMFYAKNAIEKTGVSAN
jgi:hypothetical protein